MDTHHVGDTFFVRSDTCDDYSFFWDIWINAKTLKGYRIGVYGAHRSSECRKNCIELLPSVEELNRLQEKTMDYVRASCTDINALNEWALDCLLSYNELYYRFFEAASRH